MAQIELSSDEDVGPGGKYEYSEENKGCNEFTETIELIEASAEELDQWGKQPYTNFKDMYNIITSRFICVSISLYYKCFLL